MEIALYHKHYNEEHLNEVTAEMVRRGAPVIRAIWSECYNLWMAVEGCHRLRAAQNLGLTPIIKDISEQKTATIQIDGEMVKVKLDDFASDLQSEVWKSEILKF